MKKRILIISAVPTHPDNAGHRSRVRSVADQLKKTGSIVFFVYLKGRFHTKDEDMPALRKYWGKRLFVFPHKNFQPRRDSKGRPAGPWDADAWLSPGLEQKLKKLAQKIAPDIVVAEYAAISKALQCFGGNVLKVLDTVDIYAGRDEKLLKHGIPLSGWYSLNAPQEKTAVKRADIIIAIQNEEKKHFLKIGCKKVVEIGHSFPPRRPAFKKNKHPKILFVGAAGQVSKKSAEYFIREILPLVRKKIPSAKFYIAGGVSSLLEDHPGCVRMGRVKDLAPVYAAADVVVNSEIFATGLSSKNALALAHSKPLVTTPAGARGMKGSGKAFLTASGAGAFAKAVVKILRDPKTARRLAHNAFRYSKQKSLEASAAFKKLVCLN